MKQSGKKPHKYTNISFVYDPDRQEFIHIDHSLSGIVSEYGSQLKPELLLSLVHPDDRLYLQEKIGEFLDGMLEGGVEFRAELASEIHHIRLTPFLLHEIGAVLIAGTIADITAEWNNHDSVHRYANKKNSILNMLAHDLRGPLEIANTLVKRMDLNLQDAGQLRDIGTISAILKESIQLIGSLIDRELLETVEVELSMKRLDVVMKVNEYIEECKRSEAAAEREFRMTSTAASIHADLDEAKFMQIMNNLLTNALKFTHPGGVITVHISESPETVLFTFSDNGIGIPREYLDELFEKFTPARRKGLNGEPSTGLGLSIVKMIIEWHKGKVWIESEENEGTNVHIEIPKFFNPEGTS